MNISPGVIVRIRPEVVSLCKVCDFHRAPAPNSHSSPNHLEQIAVVLSVDQENLAYRFTNKPDSNLFRTIHLALGYPNCISPSCRLGRLVTVLWPDGTKKEEFEKHLEVLR